MTTEESQPAPPHLDNLAVLLPVFEASDFSVGKIANPVHFDYSESMSRFVDTAYEDGWVSPEVDWPSWMETAQARRLRDDPAAIPEATVEQLQKLLTTVIRQDRFVTGALAGAFESGMLTAILRRIDQLRVDAAPGSSDN